MENLIYIIMLIIYLVFAALKKMAEEKEIQKNKAKTVTPQDEPDVFKRLEKLKKMREAMNEQHSPQKPERAEITKNDHPIDQTIPKKQSSSEFHEIPQAIPEPAMTVILEEPVVERRNNADDSGWEGGDVESAYLEEEKLESVLNSDQFNLQQAFIWKEIFDKPLALR